MSEWIVTFQSLEHKLNDIRLKTGAMLLRKWYIEKLREIAEVNVVNLRVRSPEGINKLPSSYFVVQIKSLGGLKPVTGLFEYYSGGLRLVGLDDQKLAIQSGNAILQFFESPIHFEAPRMKVTLYESLK